MDSALRISPKNLLGDWGNFEDWESGDSAEPTGWTKTGTPTIAKESTIVKFGSYALKLIGTNTGQNIYRQIPLGTDYAGRTMSIGCWVYTSGAGVTITIDDGVGTSNSSAHTGGGSQEFLSVTRKIDVSATKVQITINIPNGVTAYFDGAILVEGENIFTELEDAFSHVDEWKPEFSVKNQELNIARREGVYVPEIHLGSRQINIKGYVVGDTLTIARTNLDNLLKSLLSWKEDEKRDLYLYDDRVIEVFLDGSPSWGYLSRLKIMQYNIRFLAPDPSAKFISSLRKKQVVTSSPVEFNITYSGNFRSKPKVYFIADQTVDITSCKLENLTTGESFAFTGTVLAGNTLEVDCDNFTVNNNNVDSIAYHVGDFLKLVPGTNYLKFTGSNCTVKVDWFNRWLS